jgi:hypothetical protein
MAPYYFNDPTKFFSTDGRSGTCPSASNPKYSSVGNIAKTLGHRRCVNDGATQR